MLSAGAAKSGASLMSQLDMFAGDATGEPQAYRADPDKVRSRLCRILDQARSAAAMPWGPTRVSLYRTIVPQMTEWLPAEEAARWRADFDSEMARLEAVNV
jgi:hypothetical protein